MDDEIEETSTSNQLTFNLEKADELFEFASGYSIIVCELMSDNIEQANYNLRILREHHLVLMQSVGFDLLEFDASKSCEEWSAHIPIFFNKLLDEYKTTCLPGFRFLSIGFHFGLFAMFQLSHVATETEKKNRMAPLSLWVEKLFSGNYEKAKTARKLIKELSAEKITCAEDATIYKERFKNILLHTYFTNKVHQPRSKIDKSRHVTDDNWVLTLLRKTEGAHSEHAFIILEGTQATKSLIWFIDFVGNPVLPGMGKGKIRICAYESDRYDEDLIFRCDRKMMDIRKGDKISSTSWNLTSELGLALITTVTDEMLNPPIFNILGKKSILASSTGTSSSLPTGHNCFTWAKEKIRNLNDPNISIPEDDLISYVFSRTSHLLVDPQQRATFWYQRPVNVAVALAVGTAIGFAAGKSRTSCPMQ